MRGRNWPSWWLGAQDYMTSVMRRRPPRQPSRCPSRRVGHRHRDTPEQGQYSDNCCCGPSHFASHFASQEVGSSLSRQPWTRRGLERGSCCSRHCVSRAGFSRVLCNASRVLCNAARFERVHAEDEILTTPWSRWSLPQFRPRSSMECFKGGLPMIDVILTTLTDIATVAGGLGGCGLSSA